MKVTYIEDLNDTDRDVHAENGNWRSRRIVLAKEGVGFSFHETILYAGTETEMWYANHIEAVYCVGGKGVLVNRETGEEHEIRDGMCYLLDGNEKHTVKAESDLRMACVFNPPVTGREVHDEHGVYPLIVEDEPTP